MSPLLCASVVNPSVHAGLECRCCALASPVPILELGSTPLANALVAPERLTEPEARYPLTLTFCPECTLVQLRETVPPEVLFRDYFYLSSFSDTVLQNARALVGRLLRERRPGRVLEVASNDGYLLKNYVAAGVPALGIEPARNVAERARQAGVETFAEFFDVSLARRLAGEWGRVDVLHANNVVAHVADLHGVVGGIAEVLQPAGVAVVENHYVRDMIDRLEFDCVYHEHLCYYSATSFQELFRRHGLELVDVERLPIHGGSLRAYFQRSDGPMDWDPTGRERVARLLAEEEAWGVRRLETFQRFGARIEALGGELRALLRSLKAAGHRIAAYGASAKGTTLLHTFGIGRDLLDYVVDRSTVKQGRYTPGTLLPIRSPDVLADDRPDYVLLLTWNFEEEILQQQSDYRKAGGRFIVPLPEVRVVPHTLISGHKQ